MGPNWRQRGGGTERDVERRIRQIREIVRLSARLRPDMGLDAIFRHVVDSVSSALGFSVAALNLALEAEDRLFVVATTGLTEDERMRLVQSPAPLSRVRAVMRPEFGVSHSFFIGHEYKRLLDGVESVTVYTPPPPAGARAPDGWHPEDTLLIPFFNPRTKQLMGILSLDQPEDGRIPSLETVELAELFTQQAALAIDAARLFEERDHERQALESGLFDLLYHLEQVRQGNLNVRVQLDGTTLSPMADSLNAVLATLNTLLRNVRDAGRVVGQNTTEMRAATGELAEAADQQTRRLLDVSGAMNGMADSVQQIATTATSANQVSREALEFTKVGREAAENAAEGMIAVREMALQSVKKIKRLGESTQEIGEIVQLVSDFASQTNMLALNAAIEAARAGENGRGFAIVAQEIRNLANSSAEAAKQIHARIRSIQNDTNGVAVTIEHSTEQVVLQSELALQAGAALQAVDSVTERVARAISMMDETARQQTQTASAIAAEMAAIAQVSARTHDSMSAMRAAMERLVELANSLLASLSVFRLSEQGGPERPLLAAPYAPFNQATGFAGQTGVFAQPGVTSPFGVFAPISTPRASDPRGASDARGSSGPLGQLGDFGVAATSGSLAFHSSASAPLSPGVAEQATLPMPAIGSAARVNPAPGAYAGASASGDLRQPSGVFLMPPGATFGGGATPLADAPGEYAGEYAEGYGRSMRREDAPHPAPVGAHPPATPGALPGMMPSMMPGTMPGMIQGGPTVALSPSFAPLHPATGAASGMPSNPPAFPSFPFPPPTGPATGPITSDATGTAPQGAREPSAPPASGSPGSRITTPLPDHAFPPLDALSLDALSLDAPGSGPLNPPPAGGEAQFE